MWELDQEHTLFREMCRDFTDREIRNLVTTAEKAGTFPPQLWKPLGDAGLLGLAIPEDDGGSNGDALAVALLAEELTRASAGIAITPLVSSYMAAPHITHHGTPQQRKRWLPPIAADKGWTCP